MATVTIIIPTACEARRAALLRRAVDSVLAQQPLDLKLVVVVNGSRVDPALRDSIGAVPGVTLLQREEGNVSAARRAGMQLVDSPYYGFIDDDDEFLPGGLLPRVERLERDGSVDVVVTNGYLRIAADELMVAPGSDVDRTPVGSFLSGNWFASPGSLFRTATVGATFFATRHFYFEWTDLFFSLVAAGRRIAYIDAVTYRKYEDHPVSLSRSDASRLAYPAFLAELLERRLPGPLHEAIRQRFLRALNNASLLCLDQRNVRGAAGYHAWCLCNGGWRYAPYTRKIVAAAWRGLVGRPAVPVGKTG